ncbi:MAG: hypothetical protein M0042_11770 [Nitrospiraceae bacterium]|nr:hypothetical protein [Nitrospiraceae bacterium]
MKRTVMIMAILMIVMLTAVPAYAAKLGIKATQMYAFNPFPVISGQEGGPNKDGDMQNRVGLLLISSNKNFPDLKGLEFDTVTRFPVNEMFATDFQFSVGAVYGTATPRIGTVNYDETEFNVPLSFSFNGEIQALNQDGQTLTFLVGPVLNLNLGVATEESKSGTKTKVTQTAFGYQYGLQLGAQYGATVADFEFAPYLMLSQFFGGSDKIATTVSVTGQKDQNYSDTVNFDSFMMTTLGIKVAYKPANINFGLMYQKAPDKSHNVGYNTLAFQFGWMF